MFTGDSLTNISSFTFDFLFSHSLAEEGGRQNLSECSHRASPAGLRWRILSLDSYWLDFHKTRNIHVPIGVTPAKPPALGFSAN